MRAQSVPIADNGRRRSGRELCSRRATPAARENAAAAFVAIAGRSPDKALSFGR
jgi:hypothetical protein